MPAPRRPVKKGPATVTPEQVHARSQGALLGLAVGEAMGVTNAGRQLQAPLFPTLADGPQTELRGGGALELKRGQVSWASELAFCLSATLRNHGGYDVVEAGKTYARWVADALELPESLRLPFELILEGRSPEHTGRRVWLESAQRQRDGAALTRVAPLAVFFSLPEHAPERLAASLDDTAITHYAPLCQLASATLAGLVAAAIRAPSEQLAQAEALKVLEAQLAIAAATLGRREPEQVMPISDAAQALREDVKAAQAPDPHLYGPELHLFRSQSVRVAFRLALWELFHAPTFEAGVLDVINRAGDASVNGAVAGALLGAVHGAPTIPKRWAEGVLAAPGPGGGAHWNTYHPRFLLTLEPKG
jgi:ADP-ribosyl-[dinitrogen reductase] hydrolase